MFAYAVTTIPLIRKLEDPSWTQLWFADDSSAVGELSALRSWMDKLMSAGPLFGYYPEPAKSCLIVKEPFISLAEELFQDSGVRIVSSSRYLGGVIGDKSGRDSFVLSKVLQWTQYVEILSSIAVDQPQVAYIALVKSLQSEWIFLQRVTPNYSDLFGDIESALFTLFIPSLIGHECSSHERLLYSLSISMGGLNIKNPTTTASYAYSASRSAVCLLTDSIKLRMPFSPVDHDLNVLQVRQE